MAHVFQTEIYILKGVPLNNTYRDSIPFNNTVEQTAYFKSKVKVINGKELYFNNNSYQRAFSNILSVPIVADDIYDCNYVMFKNYSYDTVRFFYGFITQIDYINEENSEVHYELDVLQTWMFDYQLKQCFVERQHSVTDNIGQNYTPEPVEVSEYVMQDYDRLDTFNAMALIMAITDVNGGANGKLYNGIYGGSTLFAFDSEDTQAINAKIDEYKQKPDAITAMYLAPINFVPFPSEGHEIQSGIRATPIYYEGNQITVDDTFDGYKPRNKKLYTYPYTFYHVDNGNGGELNLRYEFFGNLKPQFMFLGSFIQPISVVAYPTNYKGTGFQEPFMSESLALNNYPMCSWNYDAYQAWIAQNSIPMAVSAVSKGVAAGAALTAGNPIGAAVGAIGGVVSMAGQMYQASIAADICKGSQNNGNINVANQRQNFRGGRCTITRECAARIDSFFDKYGYYVGKIQQPNIKARPHYTYIKTQGCTIIGSVPVGDMAKICSIFDSGITWWMNGNEIGNYTVNNQPV